MLLSGIKLYTPNHQAEKFEEQKETSSNLSKFRDLKKKKKDKNDGWNLAWKPDGGCSW